MTTDHDASLERLRAAASRAARPRPPAAAPSPEVLRIVGAYEQRLRQLDGEGPAAGSARLGREVRAAGIIDPAGQATLVLAAQRGYGPARTLLVLANQRLIARLALRYAASGLSHDALCQEGTIGLLHALERFDPERVGTDGAHATFPTYATHWIRQAIGRAVEEHAELPSYLHAVRVRVERVARAIEAAGGQATPSVVCEAQRVANGRSDPVEHVAHALEVRARVVLPIDALAGDGRSAVAEVVPDATAAVDRHVAEHETRRVVDDALQRLTGLQRELVTRKFGLDGHEETPNTELQTRFGLTRGALDNQLRRGLDTLLAAMGDAGIASVSDLGADP